MQKNPAPQIAPFNSRIFSVFVLCSVSVLLAMLSFAATPVSGPTGVNATSPGASAHASFGPTAIVFSRECEGAECTTAGVEPTGDGSSAPPPRLSATSSTCVPVPLVNDKCPAWDSLYNGPGAGPDGPGEGLLNSRVMAPSPDGQVVYVAGKSDADPGSGVDYDYVVIAFDAGTGQQRWASRYSGPADLPSAAPFALVVSPRGSAVFVTGTTFSADGVKAGTATVGFAADTGEQLWVALFNEPSLFTAAIDAAVSPDGRQVYIAGYGQNPDPDGTPRNQALVVAYDAATGGRLWLDRYSGDAGDSTLAFKVAANPDGSSVYVAGAKLSAFGVTTDVVLLVYDPITGDIKKETHHLTSGLPPAGIAVSPDGSRVFITEGNFETGPNNALTLAYDAAGNELWSARYRGCEELKCSSSPWYYGPITVSPDGGRVFITSSTVDRQAVKVFDTLAYDAATGEQQWVSRYEAIGGTFTGPTVTANSNAEEIYVTGFAHANDTVTLAYDSMTGAQKWVAIFAPVPDTSASDAIAVSPSGDRVFVAGGKRDFQTGDSDLFTLAYETGVLPSVRPISVHSRKTHGLDGTFDIYLPLAGNIGIECRRDGAPNAHQVVFNFATPVNVSDASVTPATGKTAEKDGPPVRSADGKEVTVNLTNVSNAQTITVKLLGVSDGTNTNDVTVQMGLLLGDVNGSRRVDGNDLTSLRQQSLKLVTDANFRNDVNVSGRIDGRDGTVVAPEAQALRTLP